MGRTKTTKALQKSVQDRQRHKLKTAAFLSVVQVAGGPEVGCSNLIASFETCSSFGARNSQAHCFLCRQIET